MGSNSVACHPAEVPVPSCYRYYDAQLRSLPSVLILRSRHWSCKTCLAYITGRLSLRRLMSQDRLSTSEKVVAVCLPLKVRYVSRDASKVKVR